ncbi:RNA 2',3'-cyclic phosphodiesterase [Pseudoalteromonas luteoviolacea]|uniref:RNA 2',3'-cyclic phosphodiesterase n=1 Tax=Pseudoalteromonas luteoviolacea TaxID=43657 RepID=UPI001EED501E|nr:RNA 2',3'-cyclic phosphodiesterase [Pseudoalteromonas luteoviolacea]MCF6440882.1 RNA 2',3'-cyclic phosphodiesterase [Pseudoalteromonas luteoviolacea]
MIEKRLFFGIGLALEHTAHIQHWLDTSVIATKASTLPRNWHLTLAFLAQTDASAEEKVIEFAHSLVQPPFQLRFDSTGYWSHNGLFYLRPDHINEALCGIAEPLRSCGEALGLYRNSYPFAPHITLFRGLKAEPSVCAPLVPFTLDVTEFHLYHSHRLEDGLHYTPIHSFALSA